MRQLSAIYLGAYRQYSDKKDNSPAPHITETIVNLQRQAVASAFAKIREAVNG